MTSSFVQLESNLRRVALSAEWLKLVDSAVALGSGSHVFTSSVHVSSKHGFGKKRARKNASDAESNVLTNAATMSGIYWWRGGRLSRQVFHWKLLPRSLASKCGRRGLNFHLLFFFLNIFNFFYFLSCIVLNLIQV